MITTIEIRTTDSQPFVLLPTYVNGKGPFEFVLDTGAGISIMTEQLAGVVGVRSTERKTAVGAGGVAMEIQLGRVESLSVAEARIENAQVAIMKELPKCVGSGVLGHSFLKDFVVRIDYQHNIISLSSSSDTERDARRMTGIPLRLAKPNRPIILVDALINRRNTYQFTLDTGASQTVVSPRLAQQIGVQGSQADTIVGAGGAVQSSTGSLQSLALGGAQVENLIVVVADIFGPLNEASGADIDGILGYNFLRRFTIILDYPNELIWFQKH